MAESKIPTTADFKALGKEVREWTYETEKELKNAIGFLNIGQSDRLLAELKGQVSSAYGVPEKISFKFPRYGVFVVKGVGRGWPISRVKDNANLLKAASTGGRTPKDWFNPTLNEKVPVLAEKAANIIGDLAINSIQIK